MGRFRKYNRNQRTEKLIHVSIFDEKPIDLYYNMENEKALLDKK